MDYKSAYNKMQALFCVFSVNRFPVFFLFLSLSAIRKIHNIMVISIDHHSASQLIHPLKSITVIGMYMPVYKQVRLVFFNQLAKTGKAPVGKTLQIFDPFAGAWATRISKPLWRFSFHQSFLILQFIFSSVYW